MDRESNYTERTFFQGQPTGTGFEGRRAEIIHPNIAEVPSRVNEAINISECIINAFIPNKEYYRFYWNLYILYLKKAEINMEDNDYDNAIINLETAKNFAMKRDSYNFSKKCQYTNTIFDHIKDDLSCELSPTDSMDYFNYTINKPLFNKLRNRNDFQQLIDI